MFNDMCDRVDVSFEAKLKAFPIMLKGLALDYYYANVTSSKNASFTFDDVCISIMSYFEGAEYKRSILNKWNNLTLKSVMGRAENEGKSMDECLQLLIKELRHLQHGLGSVFRIDDFIHNKLINACQEVSACQYACFKPSDSLAGLINDLKSSIVTYQKAHFTESSFPTEFIFFTDRRYHRSFSPRTNQDRGNRGFQDRGSTRGYQDRRNQGRIGKKCFVCQKEGCWSTKHSRDEREEAKRKFKNRFVGQMNKRIDQYIAEYEGLEDEDDQDMDGELTKEMEALMIEFPPSSPPGKDNAEAFITTFGSMENPELMTTDLVNRSFSHYLTDFHTGMNDQSPPNDQTTDHLQTSLKAGPLHTGMEDTNPDPFAYVMTLDRYTSEKFYGVMIDSGASAKSTAGYGQYLAFKKNKIDSSVDLDLSRAGAVNVQFGIGSASSIGSLTIDISFGVVEFHVVKADIPFLLSLADMDRLKVYFNNVTNSLIQMVKTPNGILRKKGSYPVIRRFGHGFLLWKNSMQTYVNQSFDLNLCYLIETELRQLHRRFGHSSTRKLYDLLERAGHEVEKSAVEKLIKFCTFCQKHGKSSGRFKFILRDDVNFNHSVIVDVMYVENSSILHVIDEATRFQAARWLQNISAKHIWDMLRLC
jgi:hypothetical protein